MKPRSYRSGLDGKRWQINRTADGYLEVEVSDTFSIDDAEKLAYELIMMSTATKPVEAS